MRLDLNTGEVIPPKLDLDALLGAEKPRIRFTSDISKDIRESLDNDEKHISKDIQDDTFGEESDISKDISSEEKKRQFIRKYRKENYKTLSLDIKKDDLKRFQNKAKSLGMSMRELVLKALEAYNEGE